MKIIKNDNGKKILIADEGKHIRDINDVYIPATEDAEEYIPYYTTTIYLADNFDETLLHELYIEENI